MLPAVKSTLPETQSLLQAVAEELKMPLIYIARSAELALLRKKSNLGILRDLKYSANSALELIDCYMLGLQLAERQQTLPLEPVSTHLVMHDVLHKLNETAKRYEVNLKLELSSKSNLVMANPMGLQAALVSMCTAFIEAQPKQLNHKIPVVTLTSYRASNNLVAGVYSTTCDITSTQLQAASLFYGKMRQPFGQLSASSAAGIFVSQNILQAMSAQLKIIKHHKQSGIAAILQPSRQLQLI